LRSACSVRAGICARLSTWRDPHGKTETLDQVVSATLVSAKKAGSFSYHDVQVARGERSPAREDHSPPGIELIMAACQECELEDLLTTATAIGECLELVDTIDSALTAKVGAKQAFSLQPLKDTLTPIGKFLSEQLEERGVAGEELDSAAAGDASESGNAGSSGEILSRADAMRMMDKISAYFLAHEPSSPIPLLMQRAKRLSSLDFLGLVKDLAPNGLSQAENIAGSGAGAGGEE
jgi:type VI secretion system protein ImpA